MPRKALTRRSSPWRSCRVNAPPVDSTGILTSAFLKSQPLSSGATGVSASSNQTMRTFSASSALQRVERMKVLAQHSPRLAVRSATAPRRILVVA